ncbi:MAG TPA: MBL fold metallo-hydrolase [Aggregatilineales bacterium]|nr:MBL fold metallo-hydrolase [Aggregatilineales bacterium]
MKVRFWGARGSVPTPMTEAELQDKIKQALANAVGVDLTDREAIDRYVERLPPVIGSTAGGNTTCVEIRAGNTVIIADCGSGMRMLGNQLMREDFGKGRGEAHIFITHTHWDHIQGFPFFNPLFVPGNKFNFYSPFPDLKARFEDQQREVYFPINVDYMRSTRTWSIIDPHEALDVAGVRVQATLLSHPGGAYAYRFEHGGKVMVFATDGEYQSMDPESTIHYVKFFQGADLLVFDSQYSFEAVIDAKRDWGHSTPKMGAELAYRADAKRLALFHHDTMATDDQLWAAVAEAYAHLAYKARSTGVNKPIEVLLAREGLSVDL